MGQPFPHMEDTNACVGRGVILKVDLSSIQVNN